MKILHYRKIFDDLLKSQTDKDKVHHLCARIALSFLDRFYYNDEFAEDYILLLCEMATSENQVIAETASSALFGFVIESLCDDFEELQTEAYNRVMSIIIDFCRRLEQAQKINELLCRFGLDNVEKIYKRAEQLRHNSLAPRNFSEIEKFVVLSRVTIGADVAITSVIIQRLLSFSKNAQIILIGDERLMQIFGGHERIKISPITYQRRGNLIERVFSWINVLEIVEKEFFMSANKSCILVDSDSRLSQLGVLPLVRDEDYLFFRSRGDISGKKLSMAELVNLWADKVLGNAELAYPKLFLPSESAKKGNSFIEKIRGSGAKKIVFINFGVGGNPRKRLEGDFEYSLLKRLLSEKDVIIILDKGFGKEESERASSICSRLRKDNFNVLEIDLITEKFACDFRSGLIGISLDIGEAASLISYSDLYIGYDSACQHIAAASSVETITIFAGTNNTRFVRRWRAFGKAKTSLIHVDTLSRQSYFDVNDIIARVMEAYQG